MNTKTLEAARKMAIALGRTQYYPPDRMQAYQRKLLEPILHHARQEVPFYATRLDPLFATDDSIRWEAWEDIPTLTRAEAHQAGDSMFAKSVPGYAGRHSENQTSGSTGTPLKIRLSALASLMSSAAAQRIFDWHQVDLSGKMAFLVDTQGRFPFPKGSLGKHWNIANPEAPACQLSVIETISNQLEWLQANKPDMLIAYPSIAAAIFELAEEREQRLPIQTFIGQGEVFNDEAKTYLAKVHNLKTIDRYGASEIGAIAAQCPTNNRFHQFYEAALMEVLDISGDHSLKEGRGRLVLTPFYNYAMPLIRYENEDQIEITQVPCSCGRTLPSIERVLGRERNVFTYIDGSRSWPVMRTNEYAPFLPARQFQVIQKTRTDIEIRFIRDTNNPTPVDREGLQGFLRERLHSSIRLEIVATNEIPRAASGKYEHWLSLTR